MMKESRNQSLETDVALLKQNQSVIEHTVITQNADVKAELNEIKTIIREIHDKLDATILGQTVDLALQKSEVAILTKEIGRVDKRINRVVGTVSTIFLAILGTILQWIGGKIA